MPKFLTLTAVLTLFVAALTLSGASQAQPQDEAETPLYLAMEGLQDGMRALRKQLETPEESTNALKNLATLQVHAQTAFANPPAPAAGIAEKEAALWSVAFRRQILEVSKTLLDVEQALLEGKAEDAKASFVKLTELKKSGHDQFQIDD